MAAAMAPCNTHSVVLPGDEVDLSKLNIKSSKRLVLGPGLDKEGDDVICCKAGVLKSRSEGGSMLWIDNHQKRVCKISNQR